VIYRFSVSLEEVVEKLETVSVDLLRVDTSKATLLLMC